MKDNTFVTFDKTCILVKSFEVPIEKGTYRIWVELAIDGETKYATSSAVVQ